jgi:DNA-directed RNA polymerase specialized sigma24 family protein
MMPAAAGISVEDIFFKHLSQFYRLALSLCGNRLTAEQTLIDAYERARVAGYIQPGWHIRWVKHCVIKSCLDFIQTQQTSETAGSFPTPCWSDSLSPPFRVALPRILFVLRVWEGLSLADACRYCAVSRAEATDILLETWMQIRTQPAYLTELATAVMLSTEQASDKS